MKRYWIGETTRDLLLNIRPECHFGLLVVEDQAEITAASPGLQSIDDGVYYDPDQEVTYYSLVTGTADAEDKFRSLLSAHDLTIHAMALEQRDDHPAWVDPFQGKADLDEGRLKHVDPDFTAKPAYLLSVAVTSAQLRHWGFRLAHSTLKLMKNMVNEGACHALQPESLRNGFQRALNASTPSAFFRVLMACGALAQLSPPLASYYRDHQSHGSGAEPAVMAAMDRARQEGQSPDALLDIMKNHAGDDYIEIQHHFGLVP